MSKQTKQTPIDWLIEQLENDASKYLLLKKQANAMFEEHIKDAYGDGLNAHRTDFCNRDEYYNKTYKEDKQ